MNELMTQWTALPNLHPAIVHLPLGILPLAFLSDLVSLWRSTAVWLDRMTTTLYVVGGLSAGLAVWAGERAQDSLVDIPPRVQPLIAEHSDRGHYVWYVFAAIAVLRGVLAWRDRHSESLSHMPMRLVLSVVALGGIVLLVQAADLGGALVYRHGVAVERGETETNVEAPTHATAPTIGEDAEVRLTRRGDGSILWRPIPPDVVALGAVVEVVQGTSFEVLSATSAGTAVAGLPVAIDGRVVLELMGTVGDVQVDAEIELESFTGTLGVAHHLGEVSGGGFFLVTTEGIASLVDERQGEREVLDAKPTEIPAGRFTLSVSSAGRHLKGMQDGRTVVHGHKPPVAPGGAGLVFDGSGVVWIHSVRVTPLEES